jgi:hypothetical protein
MNLFAVGKLSKDSMVVSAQGPGERLNKAFAFHHRWQADYKSTTLRSCLSNVVKVAGISVLTWRARPLLRAGL